MAVAKVGSRQEMLRFADKVQLCIVDLKGVSGSARKGRPLAMQAWPVTKTESCLGHVGRGISKQICIKGQIEKGFVEMGGSKLCL